MTSSIRDTAMQHVPGGYESYANNAITALEAREQRLVDELVRAAASQGISPRQTRETLTEIGFTMPTLVSGSTAGNAQPTVNAQAGVDQDALRRVARELSQGIASAVDGALENARRALNL